MRTFEEIKSNDFIADEDIEVLDVLYPIEILSDIINKRLILRLKENNKGNTLWTKDRGLVSDGADDILRERYNLDLLYDVNQGKRALWYSLWRNI
jgi:hypothetical protein